MSGEKLEYKQIGVISSKTNPSDFLLDPEIFFSSHIDGTHNGINIFLKNGKQGIKKCQSCQNKCGNFGFQTRSQLE